MLCNLRLIHGPPIALKTDERRLMLYLRRAQVLFTAAASDLISYK